MKLARVTLFMAMMLVGCVWMLLGLNLVPGTGISGDLKWAVFGGLLAMAGLAMVFWSGRRPGS